MIEKVKMMDVVGNLSYMDDVLKDILKAKVLNIVDARTELDNNAFTFNLENEKDLERNIELNYVVPFEKNKTRELNIKKAKEIMDFLGIKSIDESYLEKESDVKFAEIYEELKIKVDRLKEIEDELKTLKGIESNYELFQNVNVDLSDLANLEYFDVKFGILDKDGRFRIKKNYGNILSIIIHTSTIDENEVYMVIYPKEVSVEIDRILKSVNFQEVNILGSKKGTAKEILGNLEDNEFKLREEKKSLEEEKERFLREDLDMLKEILARVLVGEKIEELKKYMLHSKNSFYLSGFVAESQVKNIKEILSKYKEIRIQFHDPKELGLNPPTKFKNLNFFEPFELLIKMYGVPSYGEIDPTVFFGISYMILFGSMFGDLGQGAVFLILGFLISKRMNKDFGGLLKRLGLSSMIFGTLYGSVFGNEEIIKGIWFKPFENINQTLVLAIAFGVFLLTVSFILGFVNKINNKEYEEAFLGKEGLTGFLIFLFILNLGLGYMGNLNFINIKLSGILMGLSLIAMIFKRPLYKMALREKVTYENGDVAGYYIEGTFSLLEAVMSILSNIISFIRVGAFAINHVGLFLAFQTVGQMTGNKIGNIIALIVGNIVIIGLEGLIVFIQSLRLEYYEMFSKYYIGEGYEFKTEKVNLGGK